VWHVNGQPLDTVSEDIVLNSRGDATVMNKLILDMGTLPIDPASPDSTPWLAASPPHPGIDGFRIDPHDTGPDAVLCQTREARGVRNRAHELHRSSGPPRGRGHRESALRHGQDRP
jgi:hypothetical protein